MNTKARKLPRSVCPGVVQARLKTVVRSNEEWTLYPNVNFGDRSRRFRNKYANILTARVSILVSKMLFNDLGKSRKESRVCFYNAGTRITIKSA